MLVPWVRRPTTPEGWKVLGCLLLCASLVFVAVGVYTCLKTGFDDPYARPLIVRVFLSAGIAAAAGYALRRAVE